MDTNTIQQYQATNARHPLTGNIDLQSMLSSA